MKLSGYRQYMNEINSEKGLSREDELKHFTAYNKENNRKSYNTIFTSNAKFVVKVAHNYKNQGIALEDLIGAGNMGLARAIEEFDVSTGNKFISYAVWWIKQCILNELATQSRFFSITGPEATKKYKIDKLAIKLSQKLFREPTTQELCDAFQEKYKLKDPPYRHIELMEVLKPQPSIYKLVGDNQNNTLGDLCEDKTSAKVDEELSNSDMQQKCIELLDSMSSLNDRERSVLKLHCGLNETQSPCNLAEIGSRVGNLTRERIRQIKKEAIAKIQKDNHVRQQNNLPHFEKELI